jgi:hypothetical protein
MLSLVRLVFFPVPSWRQFHVFFAKNGRTPVKCCYWKHKSNNRTNRNNNYSGLRNVLFKTRSKYKLTI